MRCPYDPKPLLGLPMGMLHCPLCGEMIVAGMEHPEYGLLDEEREIMGRVMDRALENKFEQLAERALTEARKIKCDLQDYAEGLLVMINTIQEEYTATCEELSSEG